MMGRGTERGPQRTFQYHNQHLGDPKFKMISSHIGSHISSTPLGVALFCLCSGKLLQCARQTRVVVIATSKSGKICCLPLGVIFQHDAKTDTNAESSPLIMYDSVGFLSDTLEVHSTIPGFLVCKSKDRYSSLYCLFIVTPGCRVFL